MKFLAWAAAALAAAASFLPVQSVADTITPRFVVVKPGESPADTWRRAVRDGALAAHGIATRPATVYDAASRAATAPIIVSGKIISASVDVTAQPATPKLSFKYSTPGLFYYAYFEFVAPGGQILFTVYEAPYPAAKSGQITFESLLDTLSLYAQPGAWTLTEAEIVDGTNTATQYTGSQLATLFPSLTFTVVNKGKVDFTPPTVSAGKVLTPKVSLGATYPYFKAQLTVADDVSGVAYPIVFIGPTTEEGISLDSVVPLPVLSGKVTSATPVTFFADPPTGTWYILGYGAVDVAGNFFEDLTSADVVSLFGTDTFKVTK
jgi:hypothetical protein